MNERAPSEFRAILNTRWSCRAFLDKEVPREIVDEMFAVAQQSPFVREFLELPDDRLVVCAISFGYADLANPVNSFRTSRAQVDDAVTYIA